MTLPLLHVQDPDVQRNFDTLAQTFPVDGQNSALYRFPRTVTALPTTPPVNGQVIYYQNAAMATAGVRWQFQYNASSASAYKWEFAGGLPLSSEGVGGRQWGVWQGTAVQTYTTLATAGPAVTAPLAGEYDCSGYAVATVSVGQNLAGFIFWVTGDSTSTQWNFGDAVTVPAIAGHGHSITARRTRTAAAGNSLELRYATSNVASTANFYNRGIYITPIRVG